MFPLLAKQFPDVAKSYRDNLSAFSTKTGNHPSLRWYDDDSGHLFFRLDLNLPALFILSEPLSRFQAYKRYVIPIDAERKFYAGLALIPAYFANLNRISCINLWGTQAASFFAPYSRPLKGEEDVVWRLDPPVSNPAQLSSMNFVLKNGAIESEIPSPVKSALSDYFRYAFWSFPKPGFACNAHIIHTRDNINHILKVAKSIYLIKTIHDVRVERIAPYYSAYVQRVDLEVVNRSGQLNTFWTYVAKDVVEKIDEEIGSGNYGRLLINGLVYRFKDKVQRASPGLSLLSVASDFLPIDIEFFKTLAGLAAAERFHLDPETFGPIGSVSELRAEVERRYDHYARHIPYMGTLFDRLERPFEYVIDELFPIVVQDGQLAFFVHPIILSALLSLGKEDVIRDRDAISLVKFVKLLEKMRTSVAMRLRLTDEWEYFRTMGIDFSDLSRALFSCFYWIRLSKFLDECF